MSTTGHLSELESLRLQVADLMRELAERDRHLDRSLQDQPEQSDPLRTIVEGTATDTGEEFFRSLVRHLAQALNVRYAFVGEWREQASARVRTLAVWSGTDFAEPFEYSFLNTPCTNVIGQQFCLHESGVQRLFPEDHLLVQLEVDCYCGMPLFDKSGTPLGLLVVMDDRPITRAPLVKDLLQIFGRRVAAELQRQQADETLRESGRRLRFTQFALDHAEDGVLWADDSKRFIYANAAACRLLGYSNEELLTLSISDIAPDHDPSRFQQRLDQLKQGTAATYEESVYRRKDGTEFPIEASVTYLEYEGRSYTCGIVRDITERKLIEQDRLQALCDIQNIIETVPDIMFTLDTQGNMVKWNRRVGDVTGYSPEELLNKPALAFVPPEEQTRTAAAIQRAFTDGYAELDGHLLTKEHRLIPYHWTGALLKSPHGEPIGITGIGRDVSDKKRAEEELRQQRRHLVDAQALAHLGSWDWDVDTGEVEWSDEQFRIFGYEPGAIAVTYDTFLTSLHPNDHAPVLAAINDGLLGKRPCDVEYRIVRPNGEVRFIHFRGDVHRDATGHPLSMAGTVLDITERKQAEEALRESRQRLHAIVEGTSDAVFIKNLQGRYLLFNAAAGRFVGKSPDKVLGHDDTFIFPHAEANALMEGDRGVMASGKTFTYEDHVTTADGVHRTFSATKGPLFDAQGVVSGLFGISRDITDRKRAEEALQQSEAQLKEAQRIAHIGSWELDLVGTLLTWSDEIYRIFEIDPEKFGASYEAFLALVHPNDRDLVSWVYTESVANRTPYNIVHRLLMPDGRIKFVSEQCETYYAPDGHPLRSVGTVQDVTKQKQSEEALRLTQFTVDRAADAIFWISPMAEILYANDATSRILGYAREELLGKTVHDIDPNFTPEAWHAYWEELKQRGTSTFESTHSTKDGRTIDAEMTFNYLQFDGQEYNCAIMRDIGERKRAEASLRQSEERYRSLVDNAPIGIFVNEAGRFVYANREMQRILKAPSAEQLMGTPVLDRVAPEFHTVVKDHIHELTKGQPVPSLDEQFVRLDGSRVDVAVTAIPTSYDGTPVIQVLALDITERMQLAEREASRVRQLKKLYELSMTLSGDPGVFFEHAVRIIGELFNVQVVCLSEIVDQELYFKSVYVNGQTLMDAGHCSLATTPCATVEQAKDLRIFDCVMERFPQASFLRDHQAFSYCGFPALDNEGRVVAVTCLLDNKPHEFSKEEQDLLRIFGQRIATEIERSHHAAEQKRAADELRRSHAFIRQIIDTDPNFIFAKDREGRFILVNQAVADAYGSTVEDLVGKTDADFNANPDEVESFRLKDLEVMDSLQERFILEEAITDSTGKTRWLQTVKRPILDEQGRAIMILGAATDITDRKRMEEALHQRERDLRAAVEERERISQDLHDGILQSLFAVGLALESAKSMMSPGNRKTSGPPINQAIDQLNRVMHEIRNFIAGLGSDLLKGKDLPTALRHMLESLTQHHATRVRLAVEDRATQVLSAEQSLHLLLVIQEAVSNCIRHGRAQEATVSLKMLKQGVRLSIRDNGSGFNPEAPRRTGRGLINMAARAQKIGGRFTVFSKINEGTRVVFDLPKEASYVRR